jgi:Invasion associated locus B (IalB) protein
MNAHDVSLLPMVAAIAMLPLATWAQTPTPKQRPGTETSPAQVKPSPQPTAPKPSTAIKPAPKTTTTEPTPAKVTPTKQPTLLGQYDGWGAYWAAPDGRKVCFAAARPNGTQTNRGRTPAYLFITSRPYEKVKDEVSAIVSFPLKVSAEATAVIGKKQYALSAQSDGVWIKNQADEPKLIDDMRKGGDLVLKATTDRGLQSTDTFSMKGLAQALDRIARECK